jgi:DNA-directed RNA polymerase subunit RPC12/RpoP
MKCAFCGHTFEEPEEIFEDEEHNVECEDCHFTNLGMQQCNECYEWFLPEVGFSDDDDGDGMCNECRLERRTGNE